MRRRLKAADSPFHPIQAKVANWLSDHPNVRTLAIYSHLPGEIPLSHLVSTHPERRWVFPRVNGKTMTFHEVRESHSDLSTGSFGILEPLSHLPEVPAQEIDAFFCPGLAFDLSGRRLGRGKGFYDRILAKARNDALKIGVCHAFQLVAKIETEPHDIAMDEVISC